MRILLDTNIIIPLEDSSKALEESFSEFSRLANEHGHTLLVHPSSEEDLKRDSDKKRCGISLSRLRKYPFLEFPPQPSIKEIKALKLSQINDNDRVDNEILFALFKDAANILVSEDRKLHNKAERLGIKGRVLYLQQAAEFLRRAHARIPVSLPNIEEVPLYQLDGTIHFFDTLREDYPDFDKWFQEKARAGRKAWVHKDSEGNLGAICIYHIEEDPIVTNKNKALPGKVLKLCTFKVGETVRGRRIGELFLKAAFRYATDNGAEYIYFHTRYGKQDFLIDFCTGFGFDYFGDYKDDAVYVKEHPCTSPDSSLPAFDYHIKYFPHFKCGPRTGKFIVPIRPKYHRVLFPDNQRQRGLFNVGGSFAGLSQVAGNAIRQAYLSHARVGGLAAGDVLLFYRSDDQKGITSIGIVEQCGNYKNADEILQLVAKRTVYTREEIQLMAEKKTKVLLFRITQHLGEPIPYSWLKTNGIVKGYIQTIRKITDESFKKITTKGAMRNCLHAD